MQINANQNIYMIQQNAQWRLLSLQRGWTPSYILIHYHLHFQKNIRNPIGVLMCKMTKTISLSKYLVHMERNLLLNNIVCNAMMQMIKAPRWLEIMLQTCNRAVEIDNNVTNTNTFKLLPDSKFCLLKSNIASCKEDEGYEFWNTLAQQTSWRKFSQDTIIITISIKLYDHYVHHVTFVIQDKINRES